MRVGHILVGFLFHKNLVGVKRHRHFDIGKLLGVEMLPDIILDEEHGRSAVVYDMLGILRVEVVQNRHHDRSVGKRGHIAHNPGDAVFAHHGYFCSGFHAVQAEKYVGPGYSSGEIAVGQHG